MLLTFIVIVGVIILTNTIVNCISWPKITSQFSDRINQVSVLIPARNEEINIAACLDSVLKQGNVVSEILVYDDHSTDRTAKIILEYSERDPTIRLIQALSLPEGWCGKNYACAQLAKEASAKWLLFIDADARLSVNAINRILEDAISRDVTFLSCWPKIEMRSFVEKILMPFLNFVVFSIYPSCLLQIKNPKFQYNPRLGLAHGACMLFDRLSYEAFGGHERVKDQIFEDTRFAQLWRSGQRNSFCLDGQEVISLRMYSSFAEIWRGFQKNIFPAFQHEHNFWIFLFLHTVIFLSPILLLLINPNLKVFIASLSIILIRMILAIRFQHSMISVLLHPFGEIVLIVLGISSWWRCMSGKGVSWKGREYQSDMNTESLTKAKTIVD